MKKKILIIQHHGKFGGASKSISEFILKLRKNLLVHFSSTRKKFLHDSTSLLAYIIQNIKISSLVSIYSIFKIDI